VVTKVTVGMPLEEADPTTAPTVGAEPLLSVKTFKASILALSVTPVAVAVTVRAIELVVVAAHMYTPPSTPVPAGIFVPLTVLRPT
jgi:hypothetical protein